MKITLQIILTISMVFFLIGSMAEKKLPNKIFYYVASLILAAEIVAVNLLL